MSQFVLFESPLGVVCSRIIAHQIVVSDVWHPSCSHHNDANTSASNSTSTVTSTVTSTGSTSSTNGNGNIHLNIQTPALTLRALKDDNNNHNNPINHNNSQHIILLSCQDNRGVISANGQEHNHDSYSVYHSQPVSIPASSSSSSSSSSALTITFTPTPIPTPIPTPTTPGNLINTTNKDLSYFVRSIHKNTQNTHNCNHHNHNHNHNHNSNHNHSHNHNHNPNHNYNNSTGSFESPTVRNNNQFSIDDGEENVPLLATPSWITCPSTSANANAQLGYSMEAVEHFHNHVGSLYRRCNPESHGNSNQADPDNLDQTVQVVHSTRERLSSVSDHENLQANDHDWNAFDLQAYLEKQKQQEQQPAETSEKVKEKHAPISKSKEIEENQVELTLLPWEIASICATSSNCKRSVEDDASPTTTSTGHQVVKRQCDVSDKKYACKMCGKKYKYESNLVTHATVHTERALECEYCHKKFGRKTNYVEHLRIHTNERPYRCRYCGKSFKQNHGWRDHERTHTNERPHVCNVCGKGFTVGHNLAVHKRIHTGEKPYGCERCDKRFRQKSAYNAHMKNVHKTTSINLQGK